MGAARDWYVREICKKEGHSHGEAGELECALNRIAQLRAAQAHLQS